MKTGRMAPVKGQLTDGALSSRNGVCVHTNVHAETHPQILENTAERRDEV